jgi:Bacterial SH3 domain
MATRAGHVTTRSARYVLGPGADMPVARLVAVLLVIVPLAGLWIANNVAREAPSPAAQEIASFDPRSVLTDNTPHFLPTPVAALPAAANSGPPAPSTDEQSSAADTSPERVKVANTGGAGAILRADPPRGQQVAALRDGTVLEVIEHQTLPDGSEWLHVRTPEGTEGWVFSRLVVFTDQ